MAGSAEEAPPPADALRGADAVVHLLGEPVAQRWTDEAKAPIRDSRVLATRSAGRRPGGAWGRRAAAALVSQSATGYYGPRDDTPLDEESLGRGGLPGRA